MKTPTRDFDQDAATWDANPVRLQLADDVHQAMRAQVEFTSGMDVLDFGCGTGLHALRIAPRVRSVTGVDSSRGMLEVLEAKARQQGLANVRTCHLPSDGTLTGSYDAVVSSMTWHHVEDTVRLLAQCHHVLRTPGILCVADLDSDQGEFHGDNRGVFHFGFERPALRARFEQAGFRSVRDVTAAEVTKPAPGGALRTFRIFLMVGEKPA